MLVIDWFMWQFPRDRKILDPKKKLLRENLTTPSVTKSFFSQIYQKLADLNFITVITVCVHANTV